MTEHITGQTSSIGAVWPPQVSSHGRMRGFYTEGVVRSAGSAADFAAAFAHARIAAEQADGVSRLSIRLVAHAGSLATLARLGVPVEGALPIAGQEPGLVVAYTAANQPGRSMSPEHLARHRELLAGTQTRPRTTPENRTGNLAAQGFTPRIVNPAAAAALTPGFEPLYATFDYNRDEVTELLGNPNNTIAYVADGDRIVSTAMAEHATVHVDGIGAISMVEITEARTAPGYQGRGLYRAVSGYLIDRLRSTEHGKIDVLYGESNLAQPGVINAAHDNGRRFSAQDAGAYGLAGQQDFGILQQNFHVADGAETRQYNDFALSYVPLQ
jgi:hypothetical protein